MKKQLSISYNEEKESYILKNENKLITEISRDTLILKAKDLYGNLFADVKMGETIDIVFVNNVDDQNKPEIKKQARTLFKIIEDLLSEISNEINEL